MGRLSSVGLIVTYLELILLHTVCEALTQTQNFSKYIEIPDSINNSKIITINIYKDVFDNDIIEKLLEVENKLSNKIQEFKLAVIDEVGKSSCKSSELLPELISNIINTSSKNQDLLATSIRENGQLSKRIEELQSKLDIASQNCQGLHKTSIEEHSRGSDSNKDLQVILENLTITNRELEGKFHECQEQIFNQIESNQRLELKIKDKDISIQQLQEQLSEATQKIQDLNETSYNNSNLQVILGNLTMTNQVLERKVQEFQDQIREYTESNHELELNITEKVVSSQELQRQLFEATQNIKNLNTSLHTLTEKYLNLKESLGISDLPVNVCKLWPHSMLWNAMHNYPQSNGKVWKPSLSEQRVGKMQVKYSSSQDKYFRTVDEQDISGWENGVYKQSQFYRKVEQDQKIAYLARNDGSPEGSISWMFDVSDTNRSIDIVRLTFTRTLFSNEIIEVNMCSAGHCMRMPGGHDFFRTRNFKGLSHLEIVAKSSSSTGVPISQHAQLFRQSLEDNTSYGLDVTITLTKCDIIKF